WEKANPIICSSETGKNFLKKELKIALDVPEKMRNFLTKNMNIWVDAKDDGYMNMSKWNECVSKEMDLRKYPVWIGIDLSTTTDLSSIGMVFRLDDGSFAIKQHSFMPSDKLQERMNTDNVPFDLWEKQGYLTTTPGSVVDYSFIEQFINEMDEEGYDIQEINYDK